MIDENAKFPLLPYSPDSVQRKPVNSPFKFIFEFWLVILHCYI
jgi:hypothetical protein